MNDAELDANNLELGALIESCIRAGSLRCSAGDDKLFGGRGYGGTCACCAASIIEAEIQYEVVDSAGASLQMHLRCYNEWRKASAALDGPVSAEAAGTAAHLLPAR
jgi:hypothetical protein